MGVVHIMREDYYCWGEEKQMVIQGGKTLLVHLDEQTHHNDVFDRYNLESPNARSSRIATRVVTRTLRFGLLTYWYVSYNASCNAYQAIQDEDRTHDKQ